MKTSRSQQYSLILTKPNLTKPNLTKPNLTKPNLTKPNLTKPNEVSLGMPKAPQKSTRKLLPRPHRTATARASAANQALRLHTSSDGYAANVAPSFV